MEYKWLYKSDNKNNKLIVFFNGWGMDDSVVGNYNNLGIYDVLMFYDYNSLDCKLNFKELNKYEEKYIVAWSMGVMVATIFAEEIENIISSTAINGTLKPIDNEYGIPIRIYDLTIKGFNEKGAQRFIKSMFKDDIDIPSVKRTIENQKTELSAIKQYSANFGFKYSKILISDEDKIIPTKNQCAYWGIEPNIDGGHCIFHKFSDWGELL